MLAHGVRVSGSDQLKWRRGIAHMAPFRLQQSICTDLLRPLACLLQGYATAHRSAAGRGLWNEIDLIPVPLHACSTP